jgi:hypothetical protein
MIWRVIPQPTEWQRITDQVSAPMNPCATATRIEQRHIVVALEGIAREPNLRIVRLINEVLPVFSGSGFLPVHAGAIQINIPSSSFLALNCQIKELVLDAFDLRVSDFLPRKEFVRNSRSGKPIKKVNQRVNRFHT